MFTGCEHKFIVHEHIFKVREHKFTAREYKIYRREKKKEMQIHRLHLYLNMIREFYFTSSKSASWMLSSFGACCDCC